MLASLRRGLRAHALKASPLLLPSRFDPNFRYCSAQLSSAQLSSAQLSTAWLCAEGRRDRTTIDSFEPRSDYATWRLVLATYS
jgi:hypothetical protein